MYFVTSKRAGYCLFCLTPSERFAVGLVDDQRRVHLLECLGDDWQIRRDVSVDDHTHTAMLLQLRSVPEPATFEDFARLMVGA